MYLFILVELDKYDVLDVLFGFYAVNSICTLHLLCAAQLYIYQIHE